MRANEAGFSLIEFIVAAAILIIILGTAFQLNVLLQRRFEPAQMMVQAHANADFAVLRTADIVRGAGANPANASLFNTLGYLENPDAASVRIRSDYNGDGDVVDRHGTVQNNPDYYLVTSEDVTLRWFRDETAYNDLRVPAFSLAMIDNTPDPPGTSTPSQDVPVVIASNIRYFSCTPTGTPVTEALLTIVAGPTQPIPGVNPADMEFTRTLRIPLRNFP